VIKSGWFWSVLLLVFAAANATSADQASPASVVKPPDAFVVVLIDAKTERELGEFPYDRSVLAQSIERAAKFEARGVLLKFFIDRRKSEQGDHALAAAMRKTKVILQARLNDAEPEDNPLPARFQLDLPLSDDHPIHAREGWMPLPELSEAAHDVGFSEYSRLDRMPIVEKFRDQYVKSLYTCCLELATGKRARIEPGKQITLGDKSLPLDERDEAPVKLPDADTLEYIPLVDFLHSDFAARVKDRVVILGYDGELEKPVETPIGKVRGHRLFCYFLFSLYEQLR
jgi:hypothetical protein